MASTPKAVIFIHGWHNDKPDAAGLNFFNVAQRNLIGYAQGLAEEDERDRLKFNPSCRWLRWRVGSSRTSG
jgi:hypothetical protein